MALQPDDTGLFVWPPPHWADTLGLGLPDAEQPVVGMPDVPPVPPASQQFGQSLDPATIQLATPAPVVVPPPVPLPPAPVETPAPGVAASPPPPPELEHEQPGALQPGLGVPTEAIDAAGAALTPPPITLDPNSPDDLVALAHRDPIGYAQYLATQDEARAKEARTRLAPVMADDKRREEQDHRDYMDSMAEADRLSQEVRNTQINPNRFREHQTALEGVASFLSVVVGGLYQARHGGPNIGMQILDKAIDRDIAAQESNLANKRSLIADLRSQGLSRFQAQEAFRVATYNRALQDVQTSMQDYDPMGTAARNLAKQALEIESRIAQSSEAVRRNALDENLKLRKDARESAESLSKLRKDDLEAAKLQGALGGGGGGAAAKPAPDLVAPDEVRRRYPDLPPEAIPATPLSEAALSKHLEQYGKGQGIGDKANALTMGDFVTGEPLRQKDGREWRAPNDTQHAALAKQLNGTRDLISIAGQLDGLREIEGGSNKFTSPGAQAEYKRLVNSAVYAYAAATGVSTADENSFNSVRDALFGADPSGYNVGDVQARIRKGISDAKESANAAMRQRGRYTGPAIRFPVVTKPAETESQARIKRLTSSKSGTSGSVQDVFDTEKKGYEPSESDRADIDALAAQALAPNASWDDYNAALTNLRAVLDKTDSLTIKQYGIKTMQRLQQHAPGGSK